MYADRDSDPDEPTYPRGHDEADGEYITRPCRVADTTVVPGIGPLQMNLVLETTDGNLALPMENCQEPRMTVEGLRFYTIHPQVDDTGFTLVFKRPLGSDSDVPYEHVNTYKPEETP